MEPLLTSFAKRILIIAGISEVKMWQKLAVRPVFKVLYSPVKAFKEILEQPDIKGPLLILVLTLLAKVLVTYVSFSRMFLEMETPGRYASLLTKDLWGCRFGFRDVLIDTSLVFFLRWFVYAGALLLVIKLFEGKVGPWRVIFIVVGYIFSATVVYLVANAALISTFPGLMLPANAWNQWNPQATEEEFKVALETILQEMQRQWFPNLTYKLWFFLNFPYINPLDVWTAALCAVAVRLRYELSWKRAATISAITYLIYLPLKALIL